MPPLLLFLFHFHSFFIIVLVSIPIYAYAATKSGSPYFTLPELKVSFLTATSKS